MTNSLRFGISESVIERITDCNERVLVAGKIKRDTEFVILVVPLWFNIVTHFLLATENRLLVATKTLWSGISKVVPVSYDDVYSVVVTVKKKKLMTSHEAT